MWLDIGVPIDGVFVPCPLANIYQADGQIDAIVVRTSGILADPEPDPDPTGIGAGFLAYARGETTDLPVDSTVRLYLGNQYQQTIGAEDLDDLGSWEVCASYADRRCPMSAVTTLREFAYRPAVTDFLPDTCLAKLADAPSDTGGTRMVVLGVPEPRTCADAFAVQIWSDDLGQVTAVNLLFGPPYRP